jgi:hypothetical protein
MPYAVRVHRFESLCDLCGEANQPARFECTFLQQNTHGLASYKLHGDEEPALVLAHFIDCRDARMIQGRSDAGFRENHLPLFSMPGVFLGKEFQRDGPLELQVLGAVHHTHSAASEFRFHHVMCNFRTEHYRDRQVLRRLPAWYGRHLAQSTGTAIWTRRLMRFIFTHESASRVALVLTQFAIVFISLRRRSKVRGFSLARAQPTWRR